MIKLSKQKKMWFLITTILFLLILICSSTYSYFSGKDKVVNKLDVSELTFEIEEPSWEEPTTPVKPGDVLPKDPQIVNTGEIPFVVRVKIQEVWTPKYDTTLDKMINADYVRYFAANKGFDVNNTSFSTQKLLEILSSDSQLPEEQKNFALRLNLKPNNTNTDYWDSTLTNGWYRGTGSEKSEWLYYNKIVQPTERTEPVFRAVTIRTAEDFNNIEQSTINQTALLSTLDESETLPEVLTEQLESTYSANIEDYNTKLSQYNLEIYIYAETVQADSFAWEKEWGADIPTECLNGWK